MESPDTTKKSIQALTPINPKKIGGTFNEILSKSAESKKKENGRGFYSSKKSFNARSEVSQSRITSWIKELTPLGKNAP